MIGNYDYDNYDPDNIDLEEEMYLRDIAEEEAEMDEDESDESNDMSDNEDVTDSSDISSDISKHTKIKGVKNVKVNEAYLTKQLGLHPENNRDNFRFLYENEVYIGRVIYRLREDNYVIDATIENSGEPKKLKQFKLSKIKKVK